MESIKDRVAFVTGAASGIGLGITRALVDAGARVMMADIEAPALAAAASELAIDGGQDGGEIDTVVCDVSDRDSVFAAAEATLAETEQEYRRFQQLEDSNAAAEAQLEEARGAFRRAEAAIMMARADLEDRSVTAPFSGTLGVIDTEPMGAKSVFQS